tara:strand:- start:10231 stop:10623 length:393 start_codon:yes stop_codon:yes gene_type:complete
MLQSLIGPVSNILDKFVADADQKAALAHEIATMASKQAHEVAIAQIEVNKMEAQGNWFQSSWRPLVGWVCAISFGWHFVFQPLLIFVLTYAGLETPALPEFDMSALLTVLGGLLGLGSLRTFEKFKGVTK